MPRAEIGRSTSTHTTEEPTAPERARTLAYGIADGVLAAPSVPWTNVPAHTTDRAGRPLLLISAASAIVTTLAGGDMPATLRLSDVAPVPFPDRLRGRAWLHGRLAELPEEELRAAALRMSRIHPRAELLDLAAGDGAWRILALDVAQIELDDAWGSAVLGPDEYAAAAPDPFVAVEPRVLTHLDSAHRDELPRLLPAAVPAGTVRPLALDRYGLWLRCRPPAPDVPTSYDVRVRFAEPVSDLPGLRRAYRELFVRAVP